MKKMAKYWVSKGIKMALFVLVGGTLMSLAVMLLWNALLPSILGVTTITFWQAVGILALSRLLFGGRGGGGRHRGRKGRKREHWMKRWSNMSPEEREKMRESWGNKCGPRGRFAREDQDGTVEKHSEAG